MAARATAAAACAVLAVVVIVAMAGAPVAAADCDIGLMQAACSGPLNSGTVPDARCCRELKDQLICFCRTPGFEGYLEKPNFKKALVSCSIPPPECEP